MIHESCRCSHFIIKPLLSFHVIDLDSTDAIENIHENILYMLVMDVKNILYMELFSTGHKCLKSKLIIIYLPKSDKVIQTLGHAMRMSH